MEETSPVKSKCPFWCGETPCVCSYHPSSRLLEIAPHIRIGAQTRVPAPPPFFPQYISRLPCFVRNLAVLVAGAVLGRTQLFRVFFVRLIQGPFCNHSCRMQTNKAFLFFFCITEGFLSGLLCVQPLWSFLGRHGLSPARTAQWVIWVRAAAACGPVTLLQGALGNGYRFCVRVIPATEHFVPQREDR